MSLTLNLQYLYGISKNTRVFIEATLRAVKHESQPVMGLQATYFGQKFTWPIARKLEEEEFLEIAVFQVSKISKRKFCGRVFVNFSQLMKVPKIQFRENLIDSNNLSTNKILTFEISYQSPDSSIGGLNEDNFYNPLLDLNNVTDSRNLKNFANIEDNQRMADFFDNESVNEDQKSSIFSAPDDIDPRLRPMIEENMVGAECFQVSVCIWRGEQLAGLNINPIVNVICGPYIKKTTIKFSSNDPYYNESFKFHFNLTRNSMMDTPLKIQVYNVHANPIARLFNQKLIGEFMIDCRSIYESKEHSIQRKWALIVNPTDPLAGGQGYLKISLSCAAQGETVQRDDGRENPNEDNIEANLIKPSAHMDMTKRAMTDLRVILYRAEDLPPMNTSTMAAVKRTFLGENTEMCDPYVEVSYAGLQGQTKEKKFTYNPEWNQEIVFSDYFPPLTNRIRITVKDWDAFKDEVISTFLIDLRSIMKIPPDGIFNSSKNDGFLPTFGPSWVNLYGTPRQYISSEQEATGKDLNIAAGEGVAYRGRILMAIKTKPNPDIEKSCSSMRSCIQLGDNVCGRKNPFLLFGSIFEASLISQEFGSLKKPISFEFSIGVYGNKLDRESGAVADILPEQITKPKAGSRKQVDWYHSLTDGMIPESNEDIYYFLQYGNKKPCLFTLCEFEDQRARLCIPNIIEKLRDKFVNEMNKIRYMVEKHDLGTARHKLRKFFNKIIPVIEETITYVKNCRGTAPQTLLDKYYKREVRLSLTKIISIIQSKLSRVISKSNLIQRIRETNTIIRILNDCINCPQHPIPDLFVYMIVKNKRVAYCRIPARDIYHSANEQERGKWAGEIATFHFKKPGILGMGEGSYAIQCQLKMYIWLGMVKDYASILKGIPEGYDKNCIPPIDPPKEIVYIENSQFQLRAYIFMAKNLIASDDTGLSDPICRILIGTTVLQTQCAFNTKNPLWDITLIGSNIVFNYDAVSVKNYLQEIVVDVFDIDSDNPQKSLEEGFKNDETEFLGRALCSPHIYIDGDTYQIPKLRWWPIFRAKVRAGQILAAFDLIQINTYRPFHGLPTESEIKDFTFRFNEHVLLSDIKGLISDDEDDIPLDSDEETEQDENSEDGDEDLDRESVNKDDLSDDFNPEEEARNLIAASSNTNLETHSDSKRSNRHRKPVEKIMTGMANQELIRWRLDAHLRIPQGIRPILCKFRLEVLFWSIQELKKIGLIPVNKPKIIIDIGGNKIYSDMIENTSVSRNFKERLKWIDLYLPQDHRLWPPISMICIDHRLFGTKLVVGSAIVPELREFIKLPQLEGTYYNSSSEEEDTSTKKSSKKSDVSKADLASNSAKISENDAISNGGIDNKGYDNDELESFNGSQVPLVYEKKSEIGIGSIMANIAEEHIKKSNDSVIRSKKKVIAKYFRHKTRATKVWTQSSLPKEDFGECDWWARFYATLSSLQRDLDIDGMDKIEDVVESEDSDFAEEIHGQTVDEIIDDDEVILEVEDESEIGFKRKKWEFWKRKPKKKLTAKERREKATRRRKKRRERKRKIKRLIGVADSKKRFDLELKVDEINYQPLKEDDSWIERITIYPTCLEEVRCYDGLNNPLRSFPIYNGKMTDDEISPEHRYMGSCKGNFLLYGIESNEEAPASIEDLKLYKLLPPKLNHKILVYCYIIRALELQPTDAGGLSDPYLIVQCGDKLFNERDNCKPNNLNPVFGSIFVIETELQKSSMLYIKVCDKDTFGSDTLIGETKIDLEKRYLSPQRAAVGLMPVYYTQGYCKWKDQLTPTDILQKMCAKYNVEKPIYNQIENKVKIGSHEFFCDTEILNETGEISKSNEPLALEVLKNFHFLLPDEEDLGPLVQEHIETRPLTNIEHPGLEMGRLQMWVDIYDKEILIDPPEPVDITPRLPQSYELRVIIHNTSEVELCESGPFSHEKSTDIMIKGWVKGVGIDDQKTDVHYRSLTGDGMFNWRFLFRFEYLKHENRIQFEVKKTFQIDPRMIPGHCQLTLQVYDANLIASDKLLGEIVIPLAKVPRGAKTADACGLHQKDPTCPSVSLFRQRHLRGWWPLVAKEDDEEFVKGKVECELRLLSAEDADSSPVGLGREEPEPLLEPKRPDSSFMNFLGPLGMIIYFFKVKFKWILLKLLIISLIVLIFALFIYSFPGYISKKILNA